MTFCLAPTDRLLVLTGAGVSAESGIPTFRDAGGLWNNYRFEEVASPDAFAANPSLVWEFYAMRRRTAAACAPNPAHCAIADWERHCDERFLLVTQNVDGLHAKAGNRRLIEMHGNLFRARCVRCDRAAFDDSVDTEAAALRACELCAQKGAHALIRPDIVWFGEAIDPLVFRRIHDFVAEADRARERLYFVAAGTSGLVYPAAHLVQWAKEAGATTVLVNLEHAANASFFDHRYPGKAGEVLPLLFEW